MVAVWHVGLHQAWRNSRPRAAGKVAVCTSLFAISFSSRDLQQVSELVQAADPSGFVTLARRLIGEQFVGEQQLGRPATVTAFPFPPEPLYWAGVIYTIGHSTRGFSEFLALLQAWGVTRVGDVRRYPASRRHPQFAQDALARGLAAAGIGYLHEPDLGGRRAPRRDSRNTAWRSPAFRGYADYMETAPFQAALARLIAEARTQSTAIVCAEAVPWRCHRQLIADALVARGEAVGHILGMTHLEPHRLSAHALIQDGTLLGYPARPPEQTAWC